MSQDLFGLNPRENPAVFQTFSRETRIGVRFENVSKIANDQSQVDK